MVPPRQRKSNVMNRRETVLPLDLLTPQMTLRGRSPSLWSTMRLQVWYTEFFCSPLIFSTCSFFCIRTTLQQQFNIVRGSFLQCPDKEKHRKHLRILRSGTTFCPCCFLLLSFCPSLSPSLSYSHSHTHRHAFLSRITTLKSRLSPCQIFMVGSRTMTSTNEQSSSPRPGRIAGLLLQSSFLCPSLSIF